MRLDSGVVEELVPVDGGVVHLLVEPLLVVGLELVSELDLLSQDAVDAVVHRLELTAALPPPTAALHPLHVTVVVVVAATVVVVAPVVEPVHCRPE